jgi:hypothetical protein
VLFALTSFLNNIKGVNIYDNMSFDLSGVVLAVKFNLSTNLLIIQKRVFAHFIILQLKQRGSDREKSQMDFFFIFAEIWWRCCLLRETFSHQV